MLNELNDAAIKYMNKDMYDKAVVLLQKANGIINVVSIDHTIQDQLMGFIVFHNMAACY